MIYNLVNLSGGKDSTATVLLAAERETENVVMGFADTGHEHPLTYRYVDYLERELERRFGYKLVRVRADFTEKMRKKREYIQANWAKDGVSPERIAQALELLQPTGNTFLDLCLLHGRFPRPYARFCTTELKSEPMQEQVVEPLLRRATTQAVISWRGLRAEESYARSKRQEYEVEFGSWEPVPNGLLIYHPIISWTAEQVFDMHRKHGIKWNPLYEKGMSRVGCMPCIHANKKELRQVALRFPEAFDKLRQWEELVAKTGKRELGSTFFPPNKAPGTPNGSPATKVQEWAMTKWGGKEVIDEKEDEGVGVCNSIYGLCE